eukprot:CAMPEP_0203633594 /NCGR_PEP_ID=MMETSP0088-20131115/694_1 /ASSEMBLY_ACC=CAM_ASM_001087 /TAXON_ID=426623 /ORGANISM="Chaetoceros affinis, Strain CCMP159" /LENGTH=398 /DNA_ID=CAMNT_0050486961 /DNA_START=111 /DNA_END=1303 /DNA_ORIENTATION=+
MDGTPVAGEYDTPHMDLLGEMDMAVGSVVQHLENRRLLDDTIIIFTSDNGGLGRKATAGSSDYGHFSSGPLKGFKSSIHEGGHRVPFIIRWSNGVVPKGETRSHLVGLNDLFATLCQLAGVDVPEGQAIDSVSFADYIVDENNTKNLRDFLGVWNVKENILREESIRKNNLKLIRERETGNLFLYDLDADLSETRNLINWNKYRDTVSEMLDKLKEISPCYDNENTFEVLGSGGSKEETTCGWFRQKPLRCDTHPEGKIQCRLACARHNAKICSLMAPPSTLSPIGGNIQTVSPTVSPTVHSPPSPTLCVDSTERFTTNKNGQVIKRSCVWVSNLETESRCKLMGVSTMCPNTCGTCSTVPLPTSSPDAPPPSPQPCADSIERFVTIKDGESIDRNCG